MARPALAIGTHGSVSLTAQVCDQEGRWGTAPEGAKAQRWRARTKYRDADGKVRDVEAYDTTKAKAENALKAALVGRNAPVSGAAITPSTTVADVARLWEREHLDGGTLATASKRVYRSALHLHVLGTDDKPGALAALRVREVTVRAVRLALDDIARTSGPGAAKTVRGILMGVCRLAVEAGALPANPVREVRAPSGSKAKAEVERDHRRALTADERAALFAYIDADEFAQATDMADLIAFMLGTGVRVGEACALRWDDVTLTGRKPRATIAATLVRVAGGKANGGGAMVQEDTKTEAGRRVVHLPSWLVERLVQRERSASGMVFPSPRGKVRDQANTSQHMRAILDGAGLGWATSHTFRRTAATLMDQAGMSARAIATALGHTNPSMTMNVYMARDLGDDRAAAVL